MQTSKSLIAVPLLVAASACGGSDLPDGQTFAATSQAMTAQSVTSNDGLISVTMTSSGPDVEGQNNTYTWTATNTSNVTLTGVELGSNWADSIGQGPTLISVAPGCGGQSPNEFVNANMGVWCTPAGGVTLAPGASFSGSVTVRPLAGGPPRYNTYALYNDPLQGGTQNLSAEVHDTQPVAPSPIDIQITGTASTGSPAVGTDYSYTYQVKNNGQWASVGGIAFSDTLPSSLAIVGVSATLPFGSSCSTVGQTVSCPLADLVNGASATVTITVLAPGTAQQIVNTASANLAAPQTDTNAANNSVTITNASK